LPSDARQLDIELAAIALAEPQNVQFRYRLEPTANWTTLTNQRRVAFGDLPPGRHELEVQARYLDTEWIGPTTRLNFSAGYRLFEHPLVHGLIGAAVIAILLNIWLAMRRHQAKLQRRVDERSSQLDHATEQLEQLHGSLKKVDLRHRAALQAISHEFKGALDGALSPLLSQSADALPKDKLKEVRKKSESLNRLVALVTDFTAHGPGLKNEKPAAASANADLGKSVSVHEEAEPKPEEGASLNDKVRLQILLHLSDPDFSVEDLAENLGLSRSVLYRRVAEFSGTSPAELMRDLRLEQARRMLIESDEQISAIADATGFRSVSSFSRAFTKNIGASPRRWREEHQQAAATDNG
jgi:AraC-like DNA-binding protein